MPLTGALMTLMMMMMIRWGPITANPSDPLLHGAIKEEEATSKGRHQKL